MVRLAASSAVFALLFSHVSSALHVSEKSLAKSKFIAVMSDVTRENGLDRRISQEKLTKSILSRSKSAGEARKNIRSRRSLQNVDPKRHLEEAVADDAVADDAVADDAVADDAVAYYAAADDATQDVYESTADDEVALDDQYDNAFIEDDEFDYSDIFFDLSKFSLKFHSCASIAMDLEEFEQEDDDGENEQKNDDEDEEKEEENRATTEVVSYRLCPTDTCQDESWKGCRNTYGNYIISLQDYFEAQEEYIEEVFEQYCDYCSQCTYFYKYFNATCAYYDECTEYGSICYEEEEEEAAACEGDDEDCDEEQNDNEDEITYATFMECTEVDVLENSVYYNYCSYCKQCDYMFSYFKAECKNYANCNGYKNICYNDENKRRLEEAEDMDDMEQMYEDMEVNERVYLKLYCDGSLQIGLYADNQCATYIGDKIDMYNTTGLSFTADDIESQYMTGECISCARKVCYDFEVTERL